MKMLMKIKYMYLFVALSLFSLIYMPQTLFAQLNTNSGGGVNTNSGGPSIKLENPLAFNSIGEFVAAALQALVLIALPIVGFFILLSGFMFISARGNKEQLATAKKNFMWVIAGAILILGAWALAQLIEGTVAQLRA